MRIDTFDGQTKKLLFWEDKQLLFKDNSEKVKEYMLKHNVTGIVFSRHLGFNGNAAVIH